MSAIDKYLLVNGIVIFLVGFTMYMKPSLILGSVHQESVSRDTLSVMSGWGAALIALSTVAIQMTFLSEASINAKKYVARSLCIGWIAITNGTWHMIGNKFFGNWDDSKLKILFGTEAFLAILAAFFGFLYHPKQH
eukprot:TRINITY_DN10703_c0_g1_i1.p1 TRINITY_DN10703_c0_g1~~TRINITY_DN10703_c0_g1_i1.p1  ORF type:complete len:136 (-),score=32.02 TRINITY_DN10703_c0_g1_i1:77-484(-)